MSQGLMKKVGRNHSGKPSDRAPFFVYDRTRPFVLFCMEHGKWAGLWLAELRCCMNSLCSCVNVDFVCLSDKRNEDTRGHLFSLDTVKRAIAAESRTEIMDGYDAEFADAVIAEMREDDWDDLYHYLLSEKERAILETDADELEWALPLEVMSGEDGWVRFDAVFPFGKGFEFVLNGEPWIAHDMYSVEAGNDNHEVTLQFLLANSLKEPHRRNEKDKMPVVRYDYIDDVMTTVQASDKNQLSIEDMFYCARKSNPLMREDLSHRNELMMEMFAMAMRESKRNIAREEIAVSPSRSLVSRNAPCPCGSGKKYKKCCGA